MKFIDQFVSLEIAKKLKELGIKQQSLFAYMWRDHIKKYDLEYIHKDYDFQPNANGDIAAFNVGEIGELLPKEIDGYYFTQTPYTNLAGWCIYYKDAFMTMQITSPIEFYEKTEANVRGQALIFLLENGLLKI